MHKFILNNKFTNVLAAFFVFAATDAFATFDCQVVPDASEWCTKKGYTMSEDDCVGSSTLIKCPLDMSMLFCDTSELDGVKVCEFGDILYSNNQCYSVEPTSATPKAIVIDPEKRIALAVKYASNTPIPYMTADEFDEAASLDAFDPFSSVYGNLVDDEALVENLTPFINKAKYNSFTGYMNTLSNTALQNILGDNPNYKPFPIATNVSKLCTGEWFLPPIGVFAYGRAISSSVSAAGVDALKRFRTNDDYFMDYDNLINFHEGKLVRLWTSSFYYFSNNYPSPIAAIVSGAGFIHIASVDSSTLTANTVKDYILQLPQSGSEAFMVRCATRY